MMRETKKNLDHYKAEESMWPLAQLNIVLGSLYNKNMRSLW